MKVITLNTQKLAVGLQWEVLNHELSESKAKREAVAKANLKGVKFGIVVAMGKIGTIGLVQPPAKHPKVPSAAALLAFASQEFEIARNDSMSSANDSNWVVIERLGSNEFWVGVVRDNLPLPGTDVLLNKEGVFEILSDLFQDEPHGFTIHCPDEGLREEISSLWTARITPRSFAELTKDIKPKRGQIVQVAGISPLYLALIGAVIALGVLAYLINQMHQQSVEAAKRAAHARQEQQRQVEENKNKADYQTRVRQAVLAALDNGTKNVNKALATPSPTQAVARWMEIAHALPLSDAGWQLSSLNCRFRQGNQPECVVHVDRGSFGINRTFKDAHPDAVIDGDKASYVLVDNPLSLREANWKGLDNAVLLDHGLVSDLQLLRNTGASYKLTASKEITETVTVPPPPAGLFKAVGKAVGQAQTKEPAAIIQMGVATGGLDLSGNGLWQLQGLAELVESPSIGVSELVLTVKEGDASWSMKATYYIRSLAQPQLPTIHLADDTLITTPLPAQYAPLPASGGVASGASNTAEDPVLVSPSPTTGATNADGTVPPANPSVLPPPPPPPLPSPASNP